MVNNHLKQPSQEAGILLDALRYRTPMPVVKILAFPSVSGYSTYPVCPRCGISMEREYQHYCDRCGQALDWEAFEEALVVYYG